MKIDHVRELALKALYQINQEDGYSNLVLENIIEQERKKLTEKDVGFISELVYGVTTWKLTLDTIIQKYSKIKIKKMSGWVINILRMGAYQIVFLNKVPKSAAVNESVNLCKKYAIKSTGFVNAILRKIESKDIEEFKKILNPIERISKETSMPEWLVKCLNDSYGIKKAEEICKFSNIKPKVTIRVNQLRTTKKEVKTLLEERSIEWEEAWLKDFLYIKDVKNIINLDLYQKGYFTIQDESAALASLILSPKEGENILDCCSAPGGKTTYLAEQMKDRGMINAWDLYSNRLQLVEQNAKRLGIHIIHTQEKDASKLDEEEKEQYDRVLLDVPCLGLGVIRRKPDIKWKRKPEDIKEIQKIQMDILHTCSQYVKIGGYLVYSTCSILPEENENIIMEFLKEETFELLDPKENLNEEKKESITEEKWIHFYPNESQDGFFICYLKRKK